MYHHTLPSQSTAMGLSENSNVAPDDASRTTSPDMSVSAHPQSSSNVNDLPKEKVDAIIRKKRKAREPKACYPCHARKVKCDKQFPCDGCVKRGHGDLCSYGRQPLKRRVSEAVANYTGEPYPVATTYPHDSPSGEEGNSGALLQVPRQDWEGLCGRMKSMEDSMTQLRTTLEHISSMTTSIKENTLSSTSTTSHQGHASVTNQNQDVNVPDTDNASTDDTMSGFANEGDGGMHMGQVSSRTEHLGSKSILAYILDQANASRDSAHSILKHGVLPKLGLGNESAFPFIDLWSTSDPAFNVDQIISVLPEDEDCRIYFRAYRDITAALYPVLPDVDQFGRDIDLLLRNRAVAVSNPQSKVDANGLIYGMSMEFYGLCFAVLAAGSLASDQPARQLTSRIFVSCSYQCLRATNYLSRPTVHTTKTFLIIGSVLAYNMNPGMCYLILGISMRMGFMLGFHTNSNFSAAESFVRRHTWWAIAWQDSHFALSYDRPSAMVFTRPEIPYSSHSAPDNRSYFESLCCLISLTLNIVRERMFHPRRRMSVALIHANLREIERILQDAAPHIRDRQQCTSNRQHVERLGLKLHSSYIRSELSRPALKPHPGFSDQDIKTLKQCCVADLSKTVAAYIEIYNVSPQAARSWIIIQRTVSCAFLLAVIGESKKNTRIWSLLRQLETVIARRAIEEDDNYQENSATNDILNGEPKTGTSMSAPVTAPIPEHSNPPPPPSMNWEGSASNAPVQGGNPYSTMSSAYSTNIVPNPQDLQQWSNEDIAKSLRAIHRLNDVGANADIAPGSSPAEQTSPMTSLPIQAPASTGGGTSGGFGFYGPTIPGPDGDGAVINSDESNTMGLPNAGVASSGSSGNEDLDSLMNRASGYINPPLWY